MAQTAPATADNGAAGDADKEISKGEMPRGSRLAATKVCRTRAEWDEFYRQQRAGTEQMQRNDAAIKTPQ